MPELKSHSRLSFTVEGNPTWEQAQFGILQRIADATEAMAKNYLQLQRDAEQYRKWWQQELERRKTMERRYNAIRGVVTKMKRKAEGE